MTQIDALWSVSVACIVLSAIAVYSYHRGLIHCLINSYRWENYDFVVEGTTTFLTDKEKLMVAISSLLVAFFILEIMLAATLVRSTTLASLQPSSEHKVSITRSFLGPQTILNYFENHCEKLLSKKENPKRFKAGAASVEIKQALSSDWLTYPGKKIVHPVTSRKQSEKRIWWRVTWVYLYFSSHICKHDKSNMINRNYPIRLGTCKLWRRKIWRI